MVASHRLFRRTAYGACLRMVGLIGWSGAALLTSPATGFRQVAQRQDSARVMKRPPPFHADPPKSMSLGWNLITLPKLENPLRKAGALDEQVRKGRRVYYQNCLPCHGPRLDGEGAYARAVP